MDRTPKNVVDLSRSRTLVHSPRQEHFPVWHHCKSVRSLGCYIRYVVQCLHNVFFAPTMCNGEVPTTCVSGRSPAPGPSLSAKSPPTPEREAARHPPPARFETRGSTNLVRRSSHSASRPAGYCYSRHEVHCEASGLEIEARCDTKMTLCCHRVAKVANSSRWRGR